MDTKIAGLLGAVAAVTSLDGAQAAAPNPDPMHANTYAELLDPIPNALKLLIADDAALAANPEAAKSEELQVAAHHHHHHRHHRRHHHHHHHHHHHSYLPVGRSVG
jgi:hypothetical protein